MQTDLISVIVPIYKTEKYIHDSLESILTQTYTNLEVILVDDGSPDGCGAICDSYAEKDARIKVVHKENGGVSSALNAGLEQATGDWIVRIDPDDFAHPEMIERLYQTAKKTDAELVWCQYHNVPEDAKKNDYVEPVSQGEISEYTPVEAEKRFYDFHLEDYIVTWNKLYKASLFNEGEKLRFREGRVYEEGYIVYRLIYKAKHVAIMDEKLYYYRQRGGSIMDKNGHRIYIPVVESGEERLAFYLEKGEKELYRLEINKMLQSCIGLYQDMTDQTEQQEVKKWFKKFYKEHFVKEKWPFAKRVAMWAFSVNYGLYHFLKKLTKAS